MECWASQLGGCDGGQSGEHYVSKGLFDGSSITITGYPWCRGEARTIPLAGAKANILCKRHNELLSAADDEAIRFQDATMKFIRPIRIGKDGRLKKSPQRIVINGPLLSRWFSKTYCNCMHVGKRQIDRRFVAHAFGQHSDSPLNCFLHIAEGMILEPEGGHITLQDFWDEARNVLWFARLAGFTWLLSTLDVRAEKSNLVIGSQAIPWTTFMKEPRECSKPSEMTTCRTIAFSW